MSHLMSSLKNMEGFDKIEPVGVGSPVLYHIQEGRQRQGRDTFPAMVFSQHPDDGTVDLIVFFEPEDIIWLRRVPAWTKEQPGNSWSPVADMPGYEPEPAVDNEAIEAMRSTLKELTKQMFGDYNAPEKSFMEYLADFDQRLSALEAKGKKGK